MTKSKCPRTLAPAATDHSSRVRTPLGSGALDIGSLSLSISIAAIPRRIASVRHYYLVAKAHVPAHYSFMPRHADELVPTRATLINRLKNWQDRSSWQEFFDTYWKLIYGVARKAGLTEVEAQDVVQETMFAVAKHMPGFKYNPALGSFKGWLLNMTRWRIIDQLRKRGPVNPSHPSSNEPATGTATVERVVDPASPGLEELWEADWESTVLEAAIAGVKRRL